MKRLSLCLAFVSTAQLVTLAYSQPAGDSRPYVPELGDLMSATQLRHFKLWFAGRSQGWELAAYEVGQMRQSFEAAAAYHPKLGDADVAGMIKRDSYPPLATLASAIEARDSAAFSAAFETLTKACNSCHRETKFGFIQIRVPTASPFSNQLFSPDGK